MLTVKVSDRPSTSADYICDGISDEIEIQAAIDTVHGSGGGDVILSGIFKTTRIKLKPNVRLVGEAELVN